MDRTDTTLVLLPGMDGTARLLSRFVAALPEKVPAVAVSYPVDAPLGYDALEAQVRERLMALDASVALVAESFSGPIAVRIAAAPPPHLVAVVLVATFLRSPVPRWLRLFTRTFLFCRPPPSFVIRRRLVGFEADDALVAEVEDTIARVSPEVLAYRAREIMDTDVRKAFSRVSLPVLFCAAKWDRAVRVRRSELEALQPRLEWAELDGPHLVLHARPKQAAKAIMRFIDGVASR